jgi:hypothetical protein
MGSAFRRGACLSICASALAICLFGCARLAAELKPPAAVTVLEPYPRHADADAVAFNDLPVSLYFFTQAPPADTKILKPVRVLFRSVADGKTCREAGIGGLQKLQRVAVRNRVNAVVNIRATWEGAQLGDEIRFGCRRINNTYTLVWEGALANVPEQAAEPAQPPSEDPATATTPPALTDEESASARLRELQSLYYQGLITREEFLARRQKILDGL